MKKKLTKKENEKLYESLNKMITMYRKKNRKRIIETEIIPYLLHKTFAEKHYMMKREECVAKAKVLFERALEDGQFDCLYNTKVRK